MTEADLDTLLCEPLPAMADDGFSAKVVNRLERAAWWRERLTLFAPVAAIAAVVPFLPGEELTHAAMRLSPEIANSGAIAFAVGLIVLTLSLEKRFRETQSAL